MQFKVVTQKEPKVSTKKRAEIDVSISKNIISSVNATTNEVVQRSVLKNVFMGANNDIPVSTMYVDSEGDIVKIGICGNSHIVEIELSEANLKHIEQVCDMNVTDDKISSGITRKRVQLDSSNIDICRVTLGLWRNYISKHATIIALNVQGIRETYTMNDKVIYETTIKCKAEHKQQVIDIIRSYNKTVIEWY
jgi:hypothetical protein